MTKHADLKRVVRRLARASGEPYTSVLARFDGEGGPGRHWGDGEGGPGRHRGDHEVGFYQSDGELADLVVPFAEEGLEAGQPVIVACGARARHLLRRQLSSSPLLTFVADTNHFRAPAKTLAGWRRVVEHELQKGASRVRIVGTVPPCRHQQHYAGWDRYEAAVDDALGRLPASARCCYDVRGMPDDVLGLARKLHRSLAEPSGICRANPSFAMPGRLDEFLPPPPDPLECSVPLRSLVDPVPAAARAAVREVAAGQLRAGQLDDLVLATSEAVTNALVHGATPVEVRIWAAGGRVVVHVCDGGLGPQDALVGLRPLCGPGAVDGRGLWLAHQLDLDVDLVRVDDAFTVRLRAGLGPSPIPVEPPALL